MKKGKLVELVYLWTKSYSEGICFNQNFKTSIDFKFDDNGNIVEGSNFEINHYGKFELFDKNIQFTAIVGQNGSGKSNLLKEIFRNVNEHNISDDRKQFIQCYFQKETKTIFIDASPWVKMNLNITTNIKFMFIENNDFRDCSFFYHYKNDTDYPIFYNKYGCYNKAIIKYSEPNKNFNQINIEIEEEKNLKKLLYLLNDSSKRIESNNYFIPDKIFLSKENSRILGKSYEHNEIYRKIKVELESNKDQKNLLLLENILYVLGLHRDNQGHYLIEKIELPEINFKSVDIKNEINDFINEFIKLDIEDKIKLSRKELKNNHNIDNYVQSITTNEVEKSLFLFNNIDKIMDLFKDDFAKSLYFPDIDKLKKSDENIFILQNLPRFLKIDFVDSETGLEYSSLSTGEKALLDLIYSIKNVIELRKNLSDNIFILIDELESYLHPNWQRELINYIYMFIKEYSLNIQVILASHSPFILSDLSKVNIISLENKKQTYPFDSEQTFGANIHTLLSHGFFMGKGLMGEFAKQRLEKILKYLIKETKSINLSQEEIKYTIDLVGEELLKNKLETLYNEFYGIKSNEEKYLKRIAELEAIIKRKR